MSALRPGDKAVGSLKPAIHNICAVGDGGTADRRERHAGCGHHRGVEKRKDMRSRYARILSN